MAEEGELSLPETFLMGFYILDRNKTTFQHNEQVPNFVIQSVPFFVTTILLEYCFNFIRKKPKCRTNDGLTSISLGIIYEVAGLFTKGVELIGYEWLFKFRLFEFDWSSGLTWWAAAIGVDFGYYWVHRIAHEVGLVWSDHQVHHSSEDFNLTTALRQSAFQSFFSIGFYHPLALLGIPMPAIIAHYQFNLIYQFWIHTSIVGNLGPLEWFLNTPTHHKIHHGTNKWCIDKNYAGFLIIWDRMFGTFQSLQDEDIVYGLVSQPQSFNPVYLQLFYFRDVFQKAFSYTHWRDTIRTLCYGPGWYPGTARLGDPNDFPDKTLSRKKYDPKIPRLLNCYVFVHFFIIIYFHNMLSLNYMVLPWDSTLLLVLFIFSSLYTISLFFEAKWWAPLIEAVRCVITAAFLSRCEMTGYHYIDLLLVCYFSLSALFWMSQSIALKSGIQIQEKKKKQKKKK